LIHNCILEALGKPDEELGTDWDFWATPALKALKDPYSRYLSAWKARLELVGDGREQPANEGQSVSISVRGMILSWRPRITMAKQTKQENPICTQFVNDDIKQYKELASMFVALKLAVKSKTGLTNLKMLVLLDLKLLLGADVQWHKKMDGTRSGTTDVLDAAGPGADGSESENSEKDPVIQEGAAAPEGAATAARAEAGTAGADKVAKVAPNLSDFTTWTPDSWDAAVPFSDLSFPVDKPLIQNKCYLAVAILFTHKVALRTQHAGMWAGLRAAWESQYGVELTEETLGKPPTAGPNKYTAAEVAWCEGTLQFLTQGGRQPRREARRPAAAKSVDKSSTQKKHSRDDEGGER
jgi:hypothetical protein